MLTLDGDNRYWGRGATGNRILTEGEVSRLYARREKWHVDRKAWLAGYVEAPPISFEQPLDHIGLMLTVDRPVSPAGEFVRTLVAPALPNQFLRDNLTRIGNEQDPYPNQGTSGLGQAYTLLRQGADRWVLFTERDLSARYQARVEVAADGELAYWHSPVINQAARSGGSDRLFLMEQSVTRGVHQGLAASRWLLEQGGYVGSVDIGVAVLGLEGAFGASIRNAFPGDEPLYGAPRYTRDERITMHEARTDLPAIVRRILAPLYDVLSAQGYDPYGEARQLPA